jgi:hypothetical protein
VPLSEHERRQLEQIEQALRADDPRFAEAVRAAHPRVHYKRRAIEAALGFVIGVGLLLCGVVINVILIAVAGFAVMLACSLWAVTSYRRMNRHHHRTRPRQGQGCWREAARGPGPAGGIGADGAAGGALAAPPGWRPLTPCCPPPPFRLDACTPTSTGPPIRRFCSTSRRPRGLREDPIAAMAKAIQKVESAGHEHAARFPMQGSPTASPCGPSVTPRSTRRAPWSALPASSRCKRCTPARSGCASSVSMPTPSFRSRSMPDTAK